MIKWIWNNLIWPPHVHDWETILDAGTYNAQEINNKTGKPFTSEGGLIWVYRCRGCNEHRTHKSTSS